MKYKDETRSVFEFRADNDSASISGHAASFLTVDSFMSTFGRSSFKKTLQERGNKVPLLSNHDSHMVIGKTTELRADSQGLRFKALVVEQTRAGADIMALVRAEVLDSMSFGFNAIKDRSGTDADSIDLTGTPKGTRSEDIRFIEEVRLKELSVVPFPSNPRSQISGYRSEEEEAEELIDEVLDTIRSAELTPERIEHIIMEIRSFVDTTIVEPLVTPEDEVRRRIENENIDIELLLMEINKL